MQNKQGDMQIGQTQHNERFSSSQITNMAAKAGPHHTISANNKAELIEGSFGVFRFTSGITLHVFEGVELEDTTASIDLPPGLVFSILLKGSLNFAIDKQACEFDADGDRSTTFAINLNRAAKLERKLIKGNGIRKVNITLPYDWTESQLKNCTLPEAAIRGFIGHHLNIQHWTTDEKDMHIAEQILSAKNDNSWSNTLFLEALSLQLAAGFMKKMQAGAQQIQTNHSLPTKRSMQKAIAIKHKIDERIKTLSSPEERLTLEGVANELGMSPSNLQRLFKETYQQTIADYVRTNQLEKAKEALLHQGITIGEAAYIAGYKYTPNFAIAFKRMFGIAPGAL